MFILGAYQPLVLDLPCSSSFVFSLFLALHIKDKPEK